MANDQEMTKTDKVDEAKSLVKSGLAVKESCTKVGISLSTYYAARKNKKKQIKKTHNRNRIVARNAISREAILGALYQHVDFQTFKQVETNWQ